MKKTLKKIYFGTIAIIGFLLSPLSWWNDIIVNIPLSYIFALPFGMIKKSYFIPMMIFGYWMTNILGLIMMHYGTNRFIKDNKKGEFKIEFIKMIIVTTMYTILISILILNGILRFPTDYIK